MIDTSALREKVLDLAIRGKLVPQDLNDEPASVLLERIRAEKEQMVKDGKLKAKDIKNDTVIFKGEDNLHYEKFSDGTVKYIEDEIPFDVPEGWAWSKINNIAFVTKLAGFEYTKYIAPTLCESGIPLFKGKNVQNSKIIYEFESFIPESVSDELVRSQITHKCILTPYVGTIGNIGIHDKTGKFHLGSNVGKIELYNSCIVLLEEYVVTYLKSSFGYKQLTKHMKATAQASISIEAIRDVYIPIPPEDEQVRMWDAISKALELIENIEEFSCDITEIIKLSKSKILDLAIRGKLVPQNQDDEPASVLLERIKAEKEELIKQGKIKRDKKESVIFKGDDNSYYEKIGDNIVCIDDEIPFDLPDKIEFVRFKNLWELLSGRDLERDEYNSDKVGIPYITGASNFSNGIIEISRWTHSPQVITQKGDLLLTCKGTVGEIAINTFGDAHIARQVMAMRNLYGLNIDYLSLCLNFYIGKIKKSAKGLIPGISREDALNLIIPFPSEQYQKDVVKCVESLFEYINEIEKSLS